MVAATLSAKALSGCTHGRLLVSHPDRSGAKLGHLPSAKEDNRLLAKHLADLTVQYRRTQNSDRFL